MDPSERENRLPRANVTCASWAPPSNVRVILARVTCIHAAGDLDLDYRIPERKEKSTRQWADNDKQSEYSLVIYEQAILCAQRGPSQNLPTPWPLSENGYNFHRKNGKRISTYSSSKGVSSWCRRIFPPFSLSNLQDEKPVSIGIELLPRIRDATRPGRRAWTSPPSWFRRCEDGLRCWWFRTRKAQHR